MAADKSGNQIVVDAGDNSGQPFPRMGGPLVLKTTKQYTSSVLGSWVNLDQLQVPCLAGVAYNAKFTLIGRSDTLTTSLRFRCRHTGTYSRAAIMGEAILSLSAGAACAAQATGQALDAATVYNFSSVPAINSDLFFRFEIQHVCLTPGYLYLQLNTEVDTSVVSVEIGSMVEAYQA